MIMLMLVYVLAMLSLEASKFLSSGVGLFVDDEDGRGAVRARVTPFGGSYLLAATPLTVFVALHGLVKLPVAVQVKLNEPPDKVTMLVLDTTTPSLLVHWKLGSG